jgi:formylglycine-generating enzyme required for sulfatase activity/proteasome lid subunit RPN8/RPN11
MITDPTAAPESRCPVQNDAIVLPQPLGERLLTEINQRLPIKSFGYFISEGDPQRPADFLIFENNIRNSPEWKGRFESYGQYFLEHEDAGFVATPEESWRIQKLMWKRGMVAVGVFHSHLRHPANFSLIDYEMHTKGFHALWHMIISVRNENDVQIRAFSTEHGGVRELPVVDGLGDARENTSVLPTRDEAISQARRLLTLRADGRPAHGDRREIFQAVQVLLATGDRAAIDEILLHGFLAGSAERYEQFLHATMRGVPGARFAMGTDEGQRAHFVGEVPRHEVELSPFAIASVPVTNAIFGLLDDKWRELPAADRQKPATGMSWYDASVFAMWMGCRLPTEAEWEFACGGGAPSEWSCGEESGLKQTGWYSENSGGEAHPVATLDPNQFGLFDMHGNVWEWCNDGYEQDYYARSPLIDPRGCAEEGSHRVSRGGSFHALSEMCRTRYRFHDPPGFSAWDLGFRLARNIHPQPQEVSPW